MYSFDEDIILKAIETFQHKLSFVYLSEEEISKVKPWIRDIDEYKTVFNNFSFSSVEKENSTKFIHLNNLMIDYCNGFFHDPINGFENLISLKKVYEHLNKVKVNSVSISNNDNIEKRKETKVEITNISDILINNDIAPEQLITKNKEYVNLENPYPKIFKDYYAYKLFQNLFDEFGNTKENLSNYSFVFHKMIYEDLIHFDLKQNSYFVFLDEFNINISRIKPLQQIGKIALRESIYAKSK